MSISLKTTDNTLILPTTSISDLDLNSLTINGLSSGFVKSNLGAITSGTIGINDVITLQTQLSRIDVSFNTTRTHLARLDVSANVDQTHLERLDVSANVANTRLSGLDVSANVAHIRLSALDVSANVAHTRLSTLDVSFNVADAHLSAIDVSLNAPTIATTLIANPGQGSIYFDEASNTLYVYNSVSATWKSAALV